MKPIKIVVMGPQGSGKTTMIKKISQITIASTSKLGAGSKRRSASKKNAMDVGRITISPEYALYLFSCQGLEQLTDSWETYSDGLVGFILLVDGEVEDSLDQANAAIKFLKTKDDIPFIVGANRISASDAKKALGLKSKPPTIAFNAENKEEIKSLVKSFFEEALKYV